MNVLIIYGCLTNYSKTQWLKTTNIYYPPLFLMSGIWKWLSIHEVSVKTLARASVFQRLPEVGESTPKTLHSQAAVWRPPPPHYSFVFSQRPESLPRWISPQSWSSRASNPNDSKKGSCMPFITQSQTGCTITSNLSVTQTSCDTHGRVILKSQTPEVKNCWDNHKSWLP